MCLIFLKFVMIKIKRLKFQEGRFIMVTSKRGHGKRDMENADMENLALIT